MNHLESEEAFRCRALHPLLIFLLTIVLVVAITLSIHGLSSSVSSFDLRLLSYFSSSSLLDSSSLSSSSPAAYCWVGCVQSPPLLPQLVITYFAAIPLIYNRFVCLNINTTTRHHHTSFFWR